MISIKFLARIVDKTIKIPIFTFWGVQCNQEIHQRSYFLISSCLFAHKSSYFSRLVLYHAQKFSKQNLRTLSLLSGTCIAGLLIGLVCWVVGWGSLKGFVGHILLSNYLPGFWQGLYVWLIFFFEVVFQAAVFPPHVALPPVINELTFSWDDFSFKLLRKDRTWG